MFYEYIDAKITQILSSRYVCQAVVIYYGTGSLSKPRRRRVQARRTRKNDRFHEQNKDCVKIEFSYKSWYMSSPYTIKQLRLK